MNKGVVVIVLAVVLILGLVGAYFALGGLNLSGDADKAEQTEGMPTFIGYVPLDPMEVTIFRGRQIEHLRMGIVLEVHGRDKVSEVEEARLILQSRMLSELTDYINLQLAEDGEWDLENIKNRVRRIAEKVVGQGYVDDVLIPEIVSRVPGQTF